MSTKKKTTIEFIKDALVVHGSKYDYSKVEYINNKTKVCIICPEHGEFWQTPKVHLMGRGCQECGKIKLHQPRTTGKHHKRKYRKFNTDTYIEECKKMYDTTQYSYEEVVYTGMQNKITVHCLKHGDFNTNAGKFINGKCGCQICENERKHNRFSSNTEEFIGKSIKLHGEKTYDYSLVNYVNNSTKVKVICHQKDSRGKEHGVFEVTPANHLKLRGCPKCKNDKLLYELKLYNIISELVGENEIIIQYRDSAVFGGLSLDFYIPKYKIGIEHQGGQHFGEHYFGISNDKIERIKNNDVLKYTICKQEGIKLLYFSYEKYSVPENYIDIVYTDIEEFKNKIKQLIN